jgi:hypothetical protein
MKRAKMVPKVEIPPTSLEEETGIESSETFTGQYWTVQSLHMRREM